MRRQLEVLGLSEKETKIYLAALELGHTTAEKLAKHAGVNRSTTYVQLDALIRKGLISTHEQGKKTYFAPGSPDLLRELIYRQKAAVNQREEALFNILPDLLQQYESAGERPLVRFFPGKHGIMTVREEVLQSKEKKLYVIFSTNEMTNMYSRKYHDDYDERRARLGIHAKALHTNKDFFEESDTTLGEIRYISGIPLTIDIRIFDDKTAFFTAGRSAFATVIQSEQMANSMKMLFEFLWAQAKQSKKN